MKNNDLISNPTGLGPSFTLKNRLIRALWNSVWFIAASWTPALMQPWRRFLLVMFGAKMGFLSDVRGSSRVWYPSFLEMDDYALIAENVICYNQAKIALESHALVSQGAHLCAGTHNIDDKSFQLLTRPILIKEGAWVAADAFVGPGVTIGKFAVLGARAVAFSNIDSYAVHIGNPAKYLRNRHTHI